MKGRPAGADRALVLRVSPYGEADAVVMLLTEQAGVVSAIARRARSSAKGRHVLEPFHTLKIEIAPSSGELFHLRASTIDRARIALLDSPARLDAAGRASRWVRTLSPRRVPEPEVFASLENVLDRLQETIDPSAALAAFGIELLETLGYGLELRGCARCAKARPEGKSAYVSGAAGGVLCESCRRGTTTNALLPGPLLDRVSVDPWSLLTATKEEVDGIAAAVDDAIAARARSVGAREGET
ncbi:MAG: DNA repair protein RecO [Polyangiales bacterium]